MLEEKLKNAIVEVPNFPKKGISFKDITPVLLQPALTREVVKAFAAQAHRLKADFIAGIDARGFLFGLAVAQELGIGFIPIRKKDKLPRPTLGQSYELEYSTAAIEVHKEDIKAGAKVIIHDDLLATGGTAATAKALFSKGNANVCGFQFLVSLDFLKGVKKLNHPEILSLCHY
jgi:adenine phosphoribosyltransferase